MSEDVFQAKGDLMKSIQNFLEKFNHYRFGEKPKILLQAWEKFFEIQHTQPDDINELFQELLEDLQIIREELSENINSLKKSPDAIAPILPTEEPEYSLCMGYEHLNTTSETELDEVLESSSKNLLPILSEYEVTFDDESDDDESLPDEDVSTEEFKVYSNPLFDDGEINSDKLDPHCFNAEFDLIKSLLNRNTLIVSSPKFDFLLKEFSSELAHINPILPGIKEADFDLEEEIHFVENLFELSDFDQDNPLFPRPPPEPPNVEFDFEPNYEEVISAVKNNNDELNEDECFDPGVEIDVFANVEDDGFIPIMIEVSRVWFIVPVHMSLDHFIEIRSGEIKVHIKVLSVLWGNRLPIWTVRCHCL
nr:hypothetical protein [Tanacetum cinerariifolium]